MKNILENYLKENIDTKIKIVSWGRKKKLPLYLLDKYNFFASDILDNHCIFIEILKESPGIEIIKKHLKMIQNVDNSHLVLLYKTISNFRRKTLIENRISFVVENGQMYMPFLGLDLKKIIEKSIKHIDLFSSSTQVTFLYFLYKQDITTNATKLAKLLKTSTMTASRILNYLYEAGLLICEIGGKTGRTKNYRRIEDPIYYRSGNRYLRNPVWKIVYIQENVEGTLIAGLEALSLITMINPPQNTIKAISKEKFDELKTYLIKDKDRIEDEIFIELEVWHYDPAIVSKEKYVDPLSLAVSLKELNDERVDNAVEEMLKKEKWYTE